MKNKNGHIGIAAGGSSIINAQGRRNRKRSRRAYGIEAYRAQQLTPMSADASGAGREKRLQCNHHLSN